MNERPPRAWSGSVALAKCARSARALRPFGAALIAATTSGAGDPETAWLGFAPGAEDAPPIAVDLSATCDVGNALAALRAPTYGGDGYGGGPFSLAALTRERDGVRMPRGER